MSFRVTHRMGNMEKVSCSALPELLKELDADPEDIEQASVSVTHESDWCLSVYRGGYIAFENLEEGEPRHMNGVPPEKIISLWQLLADGDLDALESEPWLPGY
ncbi:hypothetical protein [Microvirga calopogonii]|uniref:hypothetical protein n=1 Tax=Microvirga calopogonii TaxID=2078013 RepID=UPI000E0D8217|nr:hypothetical protein [Microvirga calopogonii]